MIKTGNRKFCIFPRFSICLSNRQERNTAFGVYRKILTRRTFASYQQVFAIGRKLNHIWLATNFVDTKHFQAVGIAHHLHLSVAPFFYFKHAHRNQVSMDRHARSISRNLYFRNLFSFAWIAQVYYFDNISIAHNKQFFLGRHIRRNFGRRHFNCRKRSKCMPPLERPCGHRVFRKTKACAQKQACTQKNFIHLLLDTSPITS